MRYRILLRCFCVVLFILTINNLWAYTSETTHVKINENVVMQSGPLFLDTYLKDNLGFTDGVNQTFNAKAIQKWIEEGGEKEDTNISALESSAFMTYINHFYDPLADYYNAGWLGNYSLIQWALMPENMYINDYSWPLARQYFYTALIGNNSEEYYAKMFRSLGQIMHLVSDAAVPAHVRNDSHPGMGLEYINPKLAVDLYEKWASKNYKDTTRINYTGITISSDIFTRFLTQTDNPISALWDQDVYTGANPENTWSTQTGLAEFTNANFVSQDTTISSYSNPNLLSILAAMGTPFVEQVIAEDGKVETTFYVLHPEKNYRLATVSYFTGWNGDYFSFDDKVWKDYAAQLIPRAVGYSSALLNYFFRGRIHVLKPVVTRGSDSSITGLNFFIKNGTLPLSDLQTVEPFESGVIEMVYSYAIPDENNPGQMINLFQTLAQPVYTVNDVNDSINSDYVSLSVSLPVAVPADAVDFSFTLVFKGKLGGEEGAVAAKVYNFNNSRIACYAQPGGPPNPSGIYTASPDGSDPYEIVSTAGPLNYFQPTWSRDGTMIAFVKQFCPDDPLSLDCGYDYNSSIVVIDLLSDQPYPGNILYELSQSDSKMFSPSFSPDGTKLVAVIDQPDNISCLVVYNLEPGTPYSIINTGDDPQLTFISVAGLAWSPKDDKIIYGIDWYKEDPYGPAIPDLGLYLINIDGTGKTPFGNNDDHMMSPVWAPDGNWIAFSSDRDGNSNIWRMDFSGDNELRIVDCSPGNCYGPAISPDGMSVAFRNGGSIFTINSDGDTNNIPVKIIDADITGYETGEVAWSPYVSPPLIESAQAVPDTILPFEFSTLHWQSAGAMEVKISGIDGKQPANGSIVVSPEATTTYIIKAIGPTGVDEMKVMVKVEPAP